MPRPPPRSTLFPYTTLFRSEEPVGQRRPGLIYGLGNLVENAVDFARTRVDITAMWSKSTAFSTRLDRKSTRLNSSHLGISYAVFCLKKKNIKEYTYIPR